MQQDIARAAAGFSLGIVSCLSENALIGLGALPLLIFAVQVLDPKRPLLLPLAVALGRLCWILPLFPLAARTGDFEALLAGLVVGPAFLYWALLLSLYAVAGGFGAWLGGAARDLGAGDTRAVAVRG